MHLPFFIPVRECIDLVARINLLNLPTPVGANDRGAVKQPVVIKRGALTIDLRASVKPV